MKTGSGAMLVGELAEGEDGEVVLLLLFAIGGLTGSATLQQTHISSADFKALQHNINTVPGGGFS
jgi:hypothetical protein